MSYISWYKEHGEKHKVIVEKMKHLSDDELIAYFRFENMVKNEADFCPLYKENKKCHDLEKLNCYFCACPNFRFDDAGWESKGKTYFSTCNIDSKDGGLFEHEGTVHQDCSKCGVPHSEAYIKKHFSRDWFAVMKNVIPISPTFS